MSTVGVVLANCLAIPAVWHISFLLTPYTCDVFGYRSSAKLLLSPSSSTIFFLYIRYFRTVGKGKLNDEWYSFITMKSPKAVKHSNWGCNQWIDKIMASALIIIRRAEHGISVCGWVAMLLCGHVVIRYLTTPAYAPELYLDHGNLCLDHIVMFTPSWSLPQVFLRHARLIEPIKKEWCFSHLRRDDVSFSVIFHVEQVLRAVAERIDSLCLLYEGIIIHVCM